MLLFFFQAEDGIRDGRVTGVQTCALPISSRSRSSSRDPAKPRHQTETLEMNSDFSMRRVRYELENTNISGDGALDCLVKLLSLDCVSTFEGASGSGHIEATGGYATQFGTEVALLDFPWFFTTLVAHGERNAKDSTPLSAVTIAFDGQTPDTLVTGRVLGAKARRLLTWLS